MEMLHALDEGNCQSIAVVTRGDEHRERHIQLACSNTIFILQYLKFCIDLASPFC